MKKILLGLIIIVALGLTFVFFMLQPKKSVSVSTFSKSFTSELKEPQEATPKTIISQKTENISHSQGALFKEFSLPQDLQKEIAEAERNGDIMDEWSEGKISIDELKKAGLTPNQFSQPQLDKKIKNITAGFSISDRTFAQNLNDCLPDKDIGEQFKVLNSEALSAMGFSALMENNYTQAQQAFTALTRDYTDTKAAPIAYLELARLMSQEGHFREAQDLINKAMSLYGDDKEYIVIAQALKKEMEANE